MEQIAIDVQNVIKTFRIYPDKGTQLKDRFLSRRRSRYEKRPVLRGISFQVKRGEAIGLIGHNGCGKSTTLKLLSKIMYPDAGSITMNGRVSSLIELGAGFHPDMSGRENIYTNASIFGLTKKEIDSRLDDIIRFSELENFIDDPVRTYSSGMYMRLAFSVAINVDADILLIDEILAVGDANFQAKCFRRLREIKAKGTTIVIVSHSLGQIEQICDRSVWLHDGLIRAEGDPKEIDLEYLDLMGQKRLEADAREQETIEPPENKEAEPSEVTEVPEQSAETKKRWGNGRARIQHIRLLNEQGEAQRIFRTGETIRIRLDYTVQETVEDAVFGIGIFNREGVQCYGTNTHIDKLPSFSLTENGCTELVLEQVPLLPGDYLLDFAIESGDGIPVDYYREACTLEMMSPVGDVGVARISHSWTL